VRIAEIYPSNQGEGRLAETPSVFVRASGCNLRCHYCDTPHTSWFPEGADWGVEEIVDRVLAFDCQHVVLTGGEPMLFAELIPVCELLKGNGLHITVETAGTLYLPVVCDLMSISPKMSNSTPSLELNRKWHDRHERVRDAPQVIDQLIEEYDYQLKFVVATRNDLPEIQHFIARHPSISIDRVLLMPEGTERERLDHIGTWLEPACVDLGYTFCPRRHIEWYGFARQT
jgi:7-carboxy-7-deazaguanine synthase